MLLLGDCLEHLRAMKPNSVDAIVTDPPYGWRFMGKAWDGEDIEKTAASKLRKNSTRPEGWKIHDGTAFAAGSYDLSDAGNSAFQSFSKDWAHEALRVLKPGGHMLVFCGPRTYHRMASGVEDAGFEIRDQLQWLFGSGFPKSLDISKAIDKAVGVKDEDRPIIGDNPAYRPNEYDWVGGAGGKTPMRPLHKFGNVSPEAKQWSGWGTALKPANEPILLARKPLSEKTVASNVLKWGTGGLNIDGSRIYSDGKRPDTFCRCAKNQGSLSVDSVKKKIGHAEVESLTNIADSSAAGLANADESLIPFDGSIRQDMSDLNIGTIQKGDTSTFLSIDSSGKEKLKEDLSSITSTKTSKTTVLKTCNACALPITLSTTRTENQGRFPANLVLDEEAAAALDEQVGYLHGAGNKRDKLKRSSGGYNGVTGERNPDYHADGGGGASRFFYVAKASKRDKGLGNTHPTVKPTRLMEYLIKLITPPNGIVLDPFMGSGSTGVAALRVGYNFIGIEKDEAYFKIAQERVGG